MIEFEESKWLYLAILAALPFIRWRGEKISGFSHVALLPKDSFTSIFIWLKKLVAASAIALMVLALAGPKSGGREVTRLGSGSSIVFVLDMSGSMESPLIEGSLNTKWKLSEDVIARFVEKRCPKDRIALIGFGSMPITYSDFTYDCKTYIEVLKNRGGDLVSTVIGWPLQNAVFMFYGLEASGKAIVLISDGEGDISNMDDLALWIKKYGIKFYWVSIGEEPKSYYDDYGGEWISVVTQFMDKLGPAYAEKFAVEKPEDFDRAFTKIDKLERGLISYKEFVPVFSWKPYVLKALLVALAVSLILAMFDFGLAKALSRSAVRLRKRGAI